MANPEHLEILKQGVGQWNKWRKQHSAVEPDLSGANLRDAQLRKADLSRASLSGANLGKGDLREADLSVAHLDGADLSLSHLGGVDFSGASLMDANLGGAYLGEANLSGAFLSGADFSRATLSFANLRGASLIYSNLNGADLSGAQLAQAHAWQTLFADIDLSDAKGLDSVVHAGPSTIGIDTIYKSHGKIPEVFLRGCGVPDEFIAYIGSMVGRPIEFYSCFISYSTKDQEFADRLYADLQAKGVRCWFAPHDMRYGCMTSCC